MASRPAARRACVGAARREGAAEGGEGVEGVEVCRDVARCLPGARTCVSRRSEKGFRLAKQMQVGPRIPVGIQL
jgi:hypothetical protein